MTDEIVCPTYKTPVITSLIWGGAENVVKKLEAITEGGKLKLPCSETVEEYVENCLKNGIDIWNPQNRFYKVSIDEMELSDMENIRNEYPKFFME